jgi:hypothetical protein
LARRAFTTLVTGVPQRIGSMWFHITSDIFNERIDNFLSDRITVPD